MKQLQDDPWSDVEKGILWDQIILGELQILLIMGHLLNLSLSGRISSCF